MWSRHAAWWKPSILICHILWEQWRLVFNWDSWEALNYNPAETPVATESPSSANVFLHHICQTVTIFFSSSPAAVILTSVSVVCCRFCIVCVGGGWGEWGGRVGGCMMFDSMLTGLTAVAKRDWPNALIFNVPTLSPLVFGHGTSTHACTATVEAEEARGTHPSACPPPPSSYSLSTSLSVSLFLSLPLSLSLVLLCNYSFFQLSPSWCCACFPGPRSAKRLAHSD